MMIPTVIGATLVVFIIMRVVPGDIAYLILVGDTGDGDVDPATLEKLREELGLKEPLYMQYLTWLVGLPVGNFGDALLTRRSIFDEVKHRLPITGQLGIMSVIFGFATGLPLGTISALRQNTWVDQLCRFTSIIFLAFPSFWLGLIVILVGLRVFDWMPPIGYNLLWENPKDNLLQLLFPSLIIGSHLMAIVARMTRSTMLEVMREDYIRTARAKGLGETTVIVRHAMKNSMIPVITIVSLWFGSLLGGTVVMETVFTIPGVGLYLIESIELRDYTVTQALVFLLATGFVLINFAVDLLYGWLDPRISHS